MDYFIENLKETAEAINKLIERKVRLVDVKRIRRCNRVKSSNRSKINFIWRSLKVLENTGYLEANGCNGPKTYKILDSQKIDVKGLLQNLKEQKQKT